MSYVHIPGEAFGVLRDPPPMIPPRRPAHPNLAAIVAAPNEQVETAAMKITPGLMESMFTGFNVMFNKGFDGAESRYREVAMVVPSITGENIYPFLGQFPMMREWIGERRIKSLQGYKIIIENRRFETTITVPRISIEDDQLGIYNPMFEELGKSAAEEPDILTFDALNRGFALPCFDGQNFFDVNHPTFDAAGLPTTHSNLRDGANPPWYLLDTSRPLKPIIYQERIKPQLQRADQDTDSRVFLTDDYIYGVRARMNAGYGLWQLAAAAKTTLNPANFVELRQSMMALRGESGRLVGVKPNVLLVPPSLEEAGKNIIEKANLAGGESNVWAGSMKLIATPWLAD